MPTDDTPPTGTPMPPKPEPPADPSPPHPGPGPQPYDPPGQPPPPPPPHGHAKAHAAPIVFGPEVPLHVAEQVIGEPVRAVLADQNQEYTTFRFGNLLAYPDELLTAIR